MHLFPSEEKLGQQLVIKGPIVAREVSKTALELAVRLTGNATGHWAYELL